jgi:hypothetical protein
MAGTPIHVAKPGKTEGIYADAVPDEINLIDFPAIEPKVVLETVQVGR